MKNSILHSGRLYEFEIQNNYQRHKQKVNQITRKKSSQMSLKSQSFLPTYPSGYKMQQRQKVNQQNDRLVRRLFEINKRKKFEILTSQDEFNSKAKLASLHKKSNEINRLKKEKQIQEENEKLVEKLLDKRQKARSKDEFMRDENDLFLLRMSRSKKKLQRKANKNKEYKQRSNQRSNNNLSLMQEYENGRISNQPSQRKRNNSTLLPNVDNKRRINHAQILRMLKKYEIYKEKDDSMDRNQNVVFKLNELQTVLVKQEEAIDSQAEQQYQAEFEGEQEANKQQVKPSGQQLSPEEFDALLKLPLTMAKQNPMDPTIKFEKIIRRKDQKREVISKIRTSKQYENQQFQAEVDVDAGQ